MVASAIAEGTSDADRNGFIQVDISIFAGAHGGAVGGDLRSGVRAIGGVTFLADAVAVAFGTVADSMNCSPRLGSTHCCPVKEREGASNVNKDRVLVSLGCVIDLEVGHVQDGQCELPARFLPK